MPPAASRTTVSARLSNPVWRRAAVLALLAALSVTGLLDTTAAKSEGVTSGAEASAERARPSSRIREGTELDDVEGVFRVAGERMIFFADGGDRFVVLENLNLERIARTVAEDPQPRRWRVRGVVTEFRETNYLLVRRAMLKTRGTLLGDD